MARPPAPAAAAGAGTVRPAPRGAAASTAPVEATAVNRRISPMRAIMDRFSLRMAAERVRVDPTAKALITVVAAALAGPGSAGGGGGGGGGGRGGRGGAA